MEGRENAGEFFYNLPEVGFDDERMTPHLNAKLLPALIPPKSLNIKKIIKEAKRAFFLKSSNILPLSMSNKYIRLIYD